MQESLEGLRDRAKLQGQQWRRERIGSQPAQGGRRGPFIGPPRKLAVVGHLPRRLRPWRPESLVPRGHSGASGRMNQVPDRSWAGDFASRAGDSGHPKIGSNTNTKMTITWASGLRFWWSWARWNHNNEIYKYIHRNIIVQQVRIKTNDERFDLSIRDEPAKPSTSKTQ
jgi:hypothetical protein